MTFYECPHCGNIAYKLYDAGVALVCCGEEMQEIAPNTVDAAQEKHLPDVKIEGNELHVQVGSVEHPMLPEHYIGWILAESPKGFAVANLAAGEAPKAVFSMGGGKPVAVYAWCNLHGLWKTEL